jgi:lysyl-tRNA synthetase class 2
MANIKELREERLAKIAEMVKLGFKPYVQEVDRSHQVGEALADFDVLQDKTVTLAGRVTSVRLMGGINFIDVKDESGEIQCLIKKGELTASPDQNAFDTTQLKFVDVGDYVEVQGSLGVSKTGQQSLFVSQLRLLSKAVRSMPDEHEGLKNIETRYRQRYVDMHLNPEVRDIMEKRIAVVKSMRNFLEDKNFVEVETPVLQPIYGGASARPFTTYHHKLETDLYLRIADELYLKRAVMAGFEKVYEFAHDFRNEGIDPAHNPEFTMLEFYWAYANYEDLMDLTEAMLETVCKEVLGTTKVTYKEYELDFKAPLPRQSFHDAIKEHSGVNIAGKNRDEMVELCREHGVEIDYDNNPPLKDLQDEFFKKTTRPKLIGPMFLTDYPAEMKPLAKTREDDPTKSASMQLVVAGEEILNAYNELNDPAKQLENWKVEQKVLDAGESDEAQPIDYDYIRALEYGMPPTAGWGLGIDRIVQVLTNQPSVKDTIMFPTLRREEFDPSEFESNSQS